MKKIVLLMMAAVMISYFSIACTPSKPDPDPNNPGKPYVNEDSMKEAPDGKKPEYGGSPLQVPGGTGGEGGSGGGSGGGSSW